jgi:molybdopterin synthase catalytic subunit
LANTIPHIRIQAEDFDIAAEIAALSQGNMNVGAVVTFSGLCRDEGNTLSALELEHYPGMAEAEITRIAEKACARWPLTGLRVVHRFGKITPGDNIVLVVAASSHRQAAFDGASYLMDFLKTRAPFWKKQHRIDGSASEWVSAKDADDDALKKWD